MLYKTASFYVRMGAVAVLAAPIAAQSQAATDEATEVPGQLREIVVTAQKRAETAQSIPISIGVVTGDEIARRADNHLDAALRNMASVEIQGLAQGDQLYIRGIGSSVDPGFADPSVALMVDGVYNGRTETLNSAAYDIDRVEVLRGPQGTLYGRNASGGSVNVVTAAPRLVPGLSGYVRGQLGNYDLGRAEAALNAGLNDDMAVRIAAFREKRHGYIDDGSADSDSWGARVKLLAKPLDWLTINFKADIFRAKGFGQNTVPVPGSAGNLNFPPPFFFTNFNPPVAIPANAGTCPGSPFIGCLPNPAYPNGWIQATPGRAWSNDTAHTPGFIERRYETYQAQVDADLGFATLSVLPAFSRNYNNLVSSFLFGSILPGGVETDTINSNYAAQPASTKYTSVETRLISQGDSALKYILGLYYLRSDGGAPLGAQTITSVTGTTGSFNQAILPGRTIAGYGQLTYSLTPTLRITGGLRVSNDHNAQRYSVSFGTVDTGEVQFTTSQSSTQYKLGVEYDLAPQSLLYAHVATGFKQGGISATVPPIPFSPEHLTAFEIGAKNRFLDNRVQLNLAAFHYRYKDYQFQTFQTLDIGTTGQTGSFPVVGNAGPTNINGGEVELDALPWKLGHVRASLTALEAKDGSASLPHKPFVNQGEFQLAGKQIQNAPKWAGTFGIDQGFDLGAGILTAGVTTHLSTGYYTTPEQYMPGAWQGGYSRTDASLRYEAGKWTVSAVVKNIENKAQTSYVFPAYRRFVTDPRTVVVSVGVEF